MFRQFVGVVCFLIFSMGITQNAHPCSPGPPLLCSPKGEAQVPRNTYVRTEYGNPNEIKITLRSEDGNSVVSTTPVEIEFGEASSGFHERYYFKPNAILLPNAKYKIDIEGVDKEKTKWGEMFDDEYCTFITTDKIDEDPPNLDNATVDITLDWADDNEKYYDYSAISTCGFDESVISKTKDAEDIDSKYMKFIPENYILRLEINGVEDAGNSIIHELYKVDSNGNKTLVSRSMGTNVNLGLRLADEIEQKESYNIYLEDIFGNKQVVPIRTGFVFNKDKSKFLAMIGDKEFRGDGTHEAAMGDGGTGGDGGGSGTIAGDSSCSFVQGQLTNNYWMLALLFLLPGTLIYIRKFST